jgi:UPF0755 protein
MRARLLSLLLAAGLGLAGCGDVDREGTGEPVRVRVRAGASFGEGTDSLRAKLLVDEPRVFRWYARLTGKATQVKPGTYEFHQDAGWRHVLDVLVAGDIVTTKLTIPEGMRLDDIAVRVAEVAGVGADSLRAALRDTAAAARFRVPGPTLEGYLYPATYTLPVDTHPDSIVAELVRTYRRVWTDERRARATAVGLSERQVVTLASIIEEEAIDPDEMPIISAVYHNRLRIGMALQADPTVQYALGNHRERLLYADIERVRDHPYNTYARPGLPPGPIASASERAIEAALYPADVPWLYFVARNDGTHVFSRTLAEHNRARASIRRERRARASS